MYFKSIDFDAKREIKVYLVHKILEVRLSSKSFQASCQINFVQNDSTVQISWYLLIKYISLLDISKRMPFSKFRKDILTFILRIYF